MMTGQWSYVAAAYLLTLALTLAVMLHSHLAMRKAERRSDALLKDRK